MGDGSKPLSKRQLEAKIQQAEDKVASILVEVYAFLDEGARALLDRLKQISELRSRGNLSSQEKQELNNESSKISCEHPLFNKYLKAIQRLTHAEHERDELIEDLEELKYLVDPCSSPPEEPSDCASGGNVRDPPPRSK